MTARFWSLYVSHLSAVYLLSWISSGSCFIKPLFLSFLKGRNHWTVWIANVSIRMIICQLMWWTWTEKNWSRTSSLVKILYWSLPACWSVACSWYGLDSFCPGSFACCTTSAFNKRISLQVCSILVLQRLKVRSFGPDVAVPNDSFAKEKVQEMQDILHPDAWSCDCLVGDYSRLNSNGWCGMYSPS